jgi:hypothetical protein
MTCEFIQLRLENGIAALALVPVVPAQAGTHAEFDQHAAHGFPPARE